MNIDIQAITKRFGAYTALNSVDLRIGSGELVALLGPSGSGKTTLLRIIAGLETPDGGTVLFGGEDALQRHPRDRQVGFVFQHYALFRHMTVFDNVAFGLQVRPRSQRPAKSVIADRVNELLRLVQLDKLATRYPSQLSGGQRQRVALARALAIEPRVLLLDEPFGALDAKVRKELRRWLRHLHDAMGITSVFVTHDQEEALELADRVVVMSQGRIEQVGTPTEVYRQPATAFVYDFLGDANRIECRVEGGQVRLASQGQPLGGVSGQAGPAVVYVRPHDIELQPAGDDQATGTVRRVYEVGPLVRAEVDYAGTLLEVAVPADDRMPFRAGDRVRVVLRRGLVFPADRPDRPEPMALVPFRGGASGPVVQRL
ncbi:sulfate/molybdate ABC transporter ATP-binding protein [Azospirillum picis]|uniref:Sulfate transport system ATP-binding protein n=1 Tax=Azospirillum picis TaxID=488438 RepID=A0ABU0MN14_9PROT|nr:TOBE-like domain-containing protein [Azospirillum picis]MBP2301171.1 sulfate transport system ATP-binding protein [Azospirillum picis]MDQ0534867.1 sulfate transport system ATP-binding protein [Azospirillum picis]